VSHLVIRKVDEVYNQIVTDDMGIAQEISDHFTFEVPGARFMPQVKWGVWDGKIRLLNMKTLTLYSGLMHRLEDFCSLVVIHLSMNMTIQPTTFQSKKRKSFSKNRSLV